jgi:hypothetical protein
MRIIRPPRHPLSLATPRPPSVASLRGEVLTPRGWVKLCDVYSVYDV